MVAFARQTATTGHTCCTRAEMVSAGCSCTSRSEAPLANFTTTIDVLCAPSAAWGAEYLGGTKACDSALSCAIRKQRHFVYCRVTRVTLHVLVQSIAHLGYGDVDLLSAPSILAMRRERFSSLASNTLSVVHRSDPR